MNRAAELSPEALAGRLAEIADDKKASDLVALDVRGLVGYTDFLVICTARNERQAKAIHDEVYHQIKRGGRLPARVEGEQEGVDPDGLSRCRSARLHAGSARPLPARCALGRAGAARARSGGRAGRCLGAAWLGANLSAAAF